jgi:hypothetical protein
MTWGIETVIIVIFIAVALWFVFGSTSANVERSTIERSKITNVASDDVLEYFDDTHSGGWFSNSRAMQTGAQEAFNLTGVKFGIWVTNDLNGDTNPSDALLEAYTDALYEVIFGDSPSHLLLLLVELDYGEYAYWVGRGASASTVFDSEALDILGGYLAHYWDLADPYRSSPISESEMFGKTLSETAKRIMTVTPTTAQTVMPWIFGLAAIIIVFLGVNAAIKSNTKRKLAAAEQARADAELLNTPIAGLDGAPQSDPLLDKYNNPPPPE